MCIMMGADILHSFKQIVRLQFTNKRMKIAHRIEKKKKIIAEFGIDKLSTPVVTIEAIFFFMKLIF